MPRISPFIWFDDCALEAALFYVSIFPDARMISPSAPLPTGAPRPVVVTFDIGGQRISAINGGPTYTLSPAFSLFVDCKDQAEVDHYWHVLTADGGQESMCGWLTDRFGLSWQVVPERLSHLIGNPDREKAGRATSAMFKMHKIDIAALEAAFNGED
jgi:predicted 3-demethylubiquinone-9 3-methyltransferase (glyoxalase superfamily)